MESDGGGPGDGVLESYQGWRVMKGGRGSGVLESSVSY